MNSGKLDKELGRMSDMVDNLTVNSLVLFNDGGRTFKLFEGEPLQTSFGKDLYDDIFGDTA